MRPLWQRLRGVMGRVAVAFHHHRQPPGGRRRLLFQGGLALLVVVAVVVVFVHSRGHTLSSYYEVVVQQRHRFSNAADLQLDILCPVYQRDDELRIFAQHLGNAIRSYQQQQSQQRPPPPLKDSNNNNLVGGGVTERIQINKWRLLLTRYSAQEQASAPALQTELARLTSIPASEIIMIYVPSAATAETGAGTTTTRMKTGTTATTAFERASAVNILQHHACHERHCLVTRIDVDMMVQPPFFYNAMQAVFVEQTAYFPIVWSEYFPLSAKLVDQYLLVQHQQQQNQTSETLRNNHNKDNDNNGVLQASLPSSSSSPSSYEFQLLVDPHSEHRGYWRIHGTGMYCLSGPHAARFFLDAANFRGWGGEDGDFYTKVRSQLTKHRMTRHNEPGLIHRWHAKYCRFGMDVHDDRQWKDCQGARIGQMGSPLGLQLLQDYYQKHMPEEYRHHSIIF